MKWLKMFWYKYCLRFFTMSLYSYKKKVLFFSAFRTRWFMRKYSIKMIWRKISFCINWTTVIRFSKRISTRCMFDKWIYNRATKSLISSKNKLKIFYVVSQKSIYLFSWYVIHSSTVEVESFAWTKRLIFFVMIISTLTKFEFLNTYLYR